MPTLATLNQQARGDVLIMPAPNPTVSSGAGAVLREAAATGNVKLLKALRKVGVSVWEADQTATAAVHLAASYGQQRTFEHLCDVPPPEWPEDSRAKLVGSTHAFMTLRNTDNKRALDFIFESGSTKLARLTRGDASDEEMKILREEQPEALNWTVCHGSNQSRTEGTAALHAQAHSALPGPTDRYRTQISRVQSS